jgi:hypothetical protein
MRNVQLQIADLFSADATEELGSRLRRPLEDSPSMLVGCDFFLSHRILVLAKEHTLLFTYNGGPVFQLVKSSTAPQGNSEDGAPGRTAPAATR